jgi:NADP-dependent 3-hydroxy acid dehydrogenase YdfG
MSIPAPYKLPTDAVWFSKVPLSLPSVHTNILPVTGCSSGIGASLATFISKTFNRVVATARKPSAPSYLPDIPNVLKLALDVTSKPSIDAAIEASLSHFGRLDVVMNNAG